MVALNDCHGQGVDDGGEGNKYSAILQSFFNIIFKVGLYIEFVIAGHRHLGL